MVPPIGKFPLPGGSLSGDRASEASSPVSDTSQFTRPFSQSPLGLALGITWDTRAPSPSAACSGAWLPASIARRVSPPVPLPGGPERAPARQLCPGPSGRPATKLPHRRSRGLPGPCCSPGGWAQNARLQGLCRAARGHAVRVLGCGRAESSGRAGPGCGVMPCACFLPERVHEPPGTEA